MIINPTVKDALQESPTTTKAPRNKHCEPTNQVRIEAVDEVMKLCQQPDILNNKPNVSLLESSHPAASRNTTKYNICLSKKDDKYTSDNDNYFFSDDDKDLHDTLEEKLYEDEILEVENVDHSNWPQETDYEKLLRETKETINQKILKESEGKSTSTSGNKSDSVKEIASTYKHSFKKPLTLIDSEKVVTERELQNKETLKNFLTKYLKQVGTICFRALITGYSQMFKKSIVLTEFGFKKGQLEKLLLSLNIVEISGEGDNKQITLKQNSVIQKEKGAPTFKQSLKKPQTLADFENLVMERELLNQETLKNYLIKYLEQVQNTICFRDLIHNYFKMFKKPLIPTDFGFKKGQFKKLLLSLNIVTVSGEGNNKIIRLKQNTVIKKETEECQQGSENSQEIITKRQSSNGVEAAALWYNLFE